ncbi:MAG: TlpA disulfide reductase family protein [Micromonosporaceae bacterium]
MSRSPRVGEPRVGEPRVGELGAGAAARTSLLARSARTPRLALLVFATLVAIAGCTAGQSVQNGPGSSDTNYVGGSVGMTTFKAGNRPVAPKVAGATLTGQRMSLGSYRGDVVVMNFWASWCAPCRSEAPVLSQLSRTFAARGVRFLGVNIKDPGQKNGEAYERSFGITYPSLYDPSANILLAFRSTVPPSAIPSTLVIDKTGHIAARVIGPATYTGLKNQLSQLTAGSSG